MNYDYFEQNIFISQIKPLLFFRLKPDEEITMENVYALGMGILKQDIENAKLRLIEFGNKERIIKLYSILSYFMKKEDKQGTNPVDILARPKLLNQLIKEVYKCRINTKIEHEFILLLSQFGFKNIKLQNLFALLFWFKLERTLKYLDINPRQEKVYYFGNRLRYTDYNIMSANLFFMADVSECLELRNLYNITQFEIAFNELIISQNGIFKNKKFISSIKDLLDSIEKEKVKAQNEVRNEYLKKRQKGGINRHKTKNIIKNEIIKKMFEKINGRSTNQKVTNINNKINEAINKNEFEKLAKQYDISIQLTTQIKESLQEDHFEQIYKWGLNFNKNKK